MEVVPLARIVVRERQRKSIAVGPLNELKESILGRGLLHAPACFPDKDDKNILVLSVGERRFRAISLIAKEGKTFFYDNQEIPAGSIPVVSLAEFLDEAGRFEAELDENIRREDLDWKEKAQALSDLHTLRKASNPKQGFIDTAKELISKGVKAHPRTLDAKIKEAVVITQHLNNPKIANARNATEAFSLILKQEDEAIRGALARRQIKELGHTGLVEIRNGDLCETLPKLDANIADLFIADPPYGIDASGGGFRARTVHHHNYEDTPEIAKQLAQVILTEGFRICKPRANLFMFCDIDLFPWLKIVAANMGWTPFRRPFIWLKSESEGLAPWGSAGPRITTEFIFYATKGQKGLLASPTDRLDVKRVSRHERIHAAEKPVELLRKLIECSTLPGDLVIDPCCGSGSTMVACKETRRRGLGIERDLDYYNTALANVMEQPDATGETVSEELPV